MHFSIKAAVGGVVLSQGNSKRWAGGVAGIWAVPMVAYEQLTARSGVEFRGPQKLLKKCLVPMETMGWSPGKPWLEAEMFSACK